MNLLAKLAYFLEMRRLLHSKKFDLVIDMQGLFKSAVLAAISGCSDRIGYCEMREGSGLVSKAICGRHSKEHVIERYLDVARYLGASAEQIVFPLPDLSKETVSVQEKLQKNELQGEYIVVVPGARWKTKEWPAEHYASLIKMIIADGCSVVLAGGPDDTAKGEKITELAGKPMQLINLIGQTSLRELAALIKGCKLFISADTGPLHFAAALKKPLIAMYGPTKADRTGPYGSDDATVILSTAACAGCLKKECDDWHCMYDITPEMVYAVYIEKSRRL